MNTLNFNKDSWMFQGKQQSLRIKHSFSFKPSIHHFGTYTLRTRCICVSASPPAWKNWKADCFVYFCSSRTQHEADTQVLNVQLEVNKAPELRIFKWQVTPQPRSLPWYLHVVQLTRGNKAQGNCPPLLIWGASLFTSRAYRAPSRTGPGGSRF